jgi:hypothetical protein
VVWGASRAGAHQGAAQARQEQDAAAYEAEHGVPPDAGTTPPPPPPPPPSV